MPALESDRERLFVGVPVSESARLALSRQMPPLLPGNPTPIENWHFTLRFLGSTDPARRSRLIDLLHETDLGPSFEIELDTLGAFPNPRRARVVWIGVGKGRELFEKLAGKVELAVVEAGFKPEQRKFSAHLTVARLKQPDSIAGFLSKCEKIHAKMNVHEVILYRSELGRGHSRYSVVAAFPLDQRRSS